MNDTVTLPRELVEPFLKAAALIRQGSDWPGKDEAAVITLTGGWDECQLTYGDILRLEQAALAQPQGQEPIDKLLDRVAAGGMPETAVQIRKVYAELLAAIREHREFVKLASSSMLHNHVDADTKLWSHLPDEG